MKKKEEKKKKMKKKIIIIVTSIVGAVLLLCAMWVTCFVTDLNRCKNNQDPIFSVYIGGFKDGGGAIYVGPFYNYYRVSIYDQESEKFIYYYVITPWFCDLDYAKNSVRIN